MRAASTVLVAVLSAGCGGAPPGPKPAPPPPAAVAAPDLRCGVDDEPGGKTRRDGGEGSLPMLLEGDDLVGGPDGLDACMGIGGLDDHGDVPYRVVLVPGSTPLGLSRTDGRGPTKLGRCLLSRVCAVKSAPGSPRERLVTLRAAPAGAAGVGVDTVWVTPFADRFAARLLETGLHEAFAACSAGARVGSDSQATAELTLSTFRSMRDLRRVTQVTSARVAGSLGPDVDECVKKRLEELRWGDRVRPVGEVKLVLRARIRG